MNISAISSKTTITISARQDVKYLYNRVNDIVKEAHVPTNFKNDLIEISSESKKQTVNVLEQLEKFGIKFTAK